MAAFANKWQLLLTNGSTCSQMAGIVSQELYLAILWLFFWHKLSQSMISPTSHCKGWQH
jgi:hypothetical protein